MHSWCWNSLLGRLPVLASGQISVVVSGNYALQCHVCCSWHCKHAYLLRISTWDGSPSGCKTLGGTLSRSDRKCSAATIWNPYEMYDNSMKSTATHVLREYPINLNGLGGWMWTGEFLPFHRHGFHGGRASSCRRFMSPTRSGGKLQLVERVGTANANNPQLVLSSTCARSCKQVPALSRIILMYIYLGFRESTVECARYRSARSAC